MTRVPLAHPNASPDDERVAARHWAWVAPFLASDRMRVSRDGGRTYPRGTERALSRTLPDQPAAVKIYAHGLTRVFVADFDAKRADAATVEREAAAFAALVRRCGGRTLTDVSPNGGRHVYVPLSASAPWALTRRIAKELEGRYRTFDKMPMTGQESGLIRPPGARHASGGFQVLLTPREETISALSVRTNPAAFAKLARALGVDPDAPTPVLEPVVGDEWLAALDAAPLHGRRRRRLAPEWERMATTGERPGSWPSDSEARLALLRACARHGWTFGDVAGRYESGEWPHLTALYSRYTPAHARAALARDWRRALTPERLEHASSATGSAPARNINTRSPLTHPQPTTNPPTGSAAATGDQQPARVRSQTGGHADIHDWWVAVREVEKTRWAGRSGLSVRRVLRALGAAAQRTGSTVISFGLRSLAEGSGLDHTTVHYVLERLREEQSPFIVRIERAAGLEADTYELVVPVAHEQLTRLPWRSGKIRSVHPVFRHVGGAGFLVWEALAAAGDDPVISFDIAEETGLPVRTVQETLVQLGELGLVESRGKGWVAVGTLDAAATQIGADETHRSVMVEHRRSRAEWRARLRKMPRAVGDRWWEVEPPDDDGPWPGLQLVRDRLADVAS